MEDSMVFLLIVFDMEMTVLLSSDAAQCSELRVKPGGELFPE